MTPADIDSASEPDADPTSGPAGPAADPVADAPSDPVPTAGSGDAPGSRAGRNLPQAIAVGVTLGALVVLSLAFHRQLFAVVMAAAILVGMWELHRALATIGLRVAVVPVAAGCLSMIASALYRGPESLVLTFGLTCVAVLVWRVADGVEGAARDVVGSWFVVVYPCFLAGFPALMLARDDGNWRILLFILVTVCSDIGGYAAGVLLGRHPMAPSVSPKKSWEGFGGSVVLSAVAGALGIRLVLDGQLWQGLVLGAVTAVTATLGDLIESLIKRDIGIKDMGTILPGHGGIMDRLDSLVICAPVVWALLVWFVPNG